VARIAKLNGASRKNWSGFRSFGAVVNSATAPSQPPSSALPPQRHTQDRRQPVAHIPQSQKVDLNKGVAGAGRPPSLLAQANCVGIQVHRALATLLVILNAKRRKPRPSADCISALFSKNLLPSCTAPQYIAHPQLYPKLFYNV